MEASVRAVEAYRRSRLVDHVSTDDDKIAPVYRLEEVCATLRAAPVDVVKEMVEYTMKRLDHKSPVVKQKVLRLIKFAVPKAGVDFKREMQRQAAAIRQLVHYKGQMDALKGDALNKAVRDTAQEAIFAVFAEDRAAVVEEGAGRRIQGFGNTPVDRQVEESPKTILAGMIGFGSASLIKGISMVTGHSGDVPSGYTSSSGGGHRGPSTGLRRSLTSERERERGNGSSSRDKYDQYRKDDVQDSLTSSQHSEDARTSTSQSVANKPHAGASTSTPEEKLLASVTAAGGVRLQPTRDVLQAFLTDAMKLDSLNLCNALEKKLQAHSWQVRLKAMCVLEALLRQREIKTFGKVAQLFEDDVSVVLECLQSPQASLRDKTKKVLDLLGVAHQGVEVEERNSKMNLKLPPPPPPPGGGVVSAPTATPPVPVVLPDLLGTDDWDLSENTAGSRRASSANDEAQQGTETANQDGMMGDTDWSATFEADTDATKGADPFAGMAVHPSKDVEDAAVPDFFAGLNSMDDRASAANGAGRDEDAGLFAGLSVNSTEQAGGCTPVADGLAELMAGLSAGTSENGVGGINQSHVTSSKPPQQPFLPGIGGGLPMSRPTLPAVPASYPNLPIPSNAAGTVLQQQLLLMNMYAMGMAGPFAPNPMLPLGSVTGVFPQGAMQAAFTPQQFPGGVPGVPYPGFNVQQGQGNDFGSHSSDGFDFSSDPQARHSIPVESSKEDNKAFDFISDHLSSFRSSKKGS